MKKVEVVKAVAEIVVSVGVGAIVGNAIKATTPSNTGKIKKICVGVGTFILSSMVTDKAIEYTTDKIDDFVNKFSDKVVNTEE